MPVPVSIVIPTRNEEAQIAECVRDLAWADEVLVADSGSGDATVALAREAGAIVLENAGATIAAQRNAAIERARNSWVFALDADERFTEALRNEVAVTVAAPRHDAYRVRRRNFYLGRELTRGHWGRDWVTRLFPRERRFVNRRVHEHLEPLPDVGWLSAPLAPYSLSRPPAPTRQDEPFCPLGRGGALRAGTAGERLGPSHPSGWSLPQGVFATGGHRRRATGPGELDAWGLHRLSQTGASLGTRGRAGTPPRT